MRRHFLVKLKPPRHAISAARRFLRLKWHRRFSLVLSISSSQTGLAADTPKPNTEIELRHPFSRRAMDLSSRDREKVEKSAISRAMARFRDMFSLLGKFLLPAEHGSHVRKLRPSCMTIFSGAGTPLG